MIILTTRVSIQILFKASKEKEKKKNTHAKAAINQRGSKETSDKDAMIVFLWSQNSSPLFFNDSDIAKQDSKKCNFIIGIY